MPRSHEDGVDGVAVSSNEVVSLEKSVAFGVTNDRFDGAAPSQFSADCGGSLRLALRHMNVWRREPMTPVALVDVGRVTFDPVRRSTWAI